MSEQKPVAFIWHQHLGEKTKSLRWTKPNQWEYAEKVEPLYAAPPAQPAEVQCSLCKGTGVVEDGEIDCYPNGEPYLNGPVQCVKDCPRCANKSQPAQAQPARLSDERIDEIASAMFYADEPMDSMARAFRPQWLESIARPLAHAIAAAVVPPGFVVVQDWQPIETAPKDELILVGPTKRMGICVAMHHSRDGWVTETTSEWVTMYAPTHWMPLPSAAKATK